MNQWPQLRGWSLADLETRFQQRLGASSALLGVVVHGAERLASVNLVANFLVQNESDGRVDGVFLALTSAAQDDACDTGLLALNCGKETRSRTRDFKGVLGFGEQARIVDGARITALQFDHLAEFVEGFSGVDDLPGELMSFSDRFHLIAKEEHPGSQFVAKID